MARYVVLVFALSGDNPGTDPSDDEIERVASLVDAPEDWTFHTAEIVADRDAMRYVLGDMDWRDP